jgi:hypothetical protein
LSLRFKAAAAFSSVSIVTEGLFRIEQPIERSPVCSHARRRGHLRKPPVSPARGPPIDWGELVQVHDDRDVFQGRIDELPVIDIHSL